MNPQQKGYTLIEMVIVILLLSLAASGISFSEQRNSKLKLEATAAEVVSEIEYIKHRAVITGTVCEMRWFENRVLVMDENKQVIFKTYMQRGQKVSKKKSSTINPLYFTGTMAPAQGFTMVIEQDEIRRQVRITIEPATGKVRLYYEKY